VSPNRGQPYRAAARWSFIFSPALAVATGEDDRSSQAAGKGTQVSGIIDDHEQGGQAAVKGTQVTIRLDLVGIIDVEQQYYLVGPSPLLSPGDNHAIKTGQTGFRHLATYSSCGDQLISAQKNSCETRSCSLHISPLSREFIQDLAQFFSNSLIHV
jgi:hypothetical protein